MNRYPVDVEERMQALYGSLSEKDRRRYAAVEAIKVGHGGVAYVSRLFGCDPDTVPPAGAIQGGNLCRCFPVR